MYRFLGEIGGFPIRSYGLIISLAIILATGTAYFFAKQDRRGWHTHIVDMGIYCGIAGLIGARVWDVVFFDWNYYGSHLIEVFYVWQGGLSIQGGVFFGAITGIIYTKIHKIDTWALADIVAPSIIIGQTVGRCANLLNGDAFGHPTGGQFGILYPENTLAHSVYGLQPLWPVEIWEGQIDIVIFALLLMFRSTNSYKGQTFCLYIILYSVARFFLEYLRGDYSAGIGDFKSAQVTALIAAGIALCVFLYLEYKKRTTKTTA